MDLAWSIQETNSKWTILLKLWLIESQCRLIESNKFHKRDLSPWLRGRSTGPPMIVFGGFPGAGDEPGIFRFLLITSPLRSTWTTRIKLPHSDLVWHTASLVRSLEGPKGLGSIPALLKFYFSSRVLGDWMGPGMMTCMNWYSNSSKNLSHTFYLRPRLSAPLSRNYTSHLASASHGVQSYVWRC